MHSLKRFNEVVKTFTQTLKSIGFRTNFKIAYTYLKVARNINRLLHHNVNKKKTLSETITDAYKQYNKTLTFFALSYITIYFYIEEKAGESIQTKSFDCSLLNSGDKMDSNN